MDEFDALLLSAVHKGDVNLLQTYLTSILDPNVYLNRIYDEPNEQKCTLLMIACLAEYEDIVYMLLNCFKPDLEVLNIVQINDNDHTPEIYLNVTVLWAAAAINNFLIVKRLVEHGANVNHTTNTNSTPVRCTCYSGNVDMARYLVEKGADIRINKKDNETNLALSVYCKHLEMTAYLVEELGCNINECDDYGQLPLHFAVKSRSLEIVQFLLNRGAQNLPATRDKMSPLMLAAEKRSNDLVNAIAPYCSILERIEAEELIGSAFACAELGPCNLQQSYEHFCRALELRSTHNLPKTSKETTSELFNNRRECQTVDQLKELWLNPENMYTEALLVRERLFGSASEKYRYSLIYRGAVLGDDDQFHHTIAFWLYELGLRQQHSIAIDRQRLRRFTSVLSKMVNSSSSVSIKAILTIITATIEKVKQSTEYMDYNLYTLLFLITIASQPSVDVLFTITDRKTFYQLLRCVNQSQFVTQADHSSLLHLCISDLTSVADDSISLNCKYPCLHTLRTLLRCGVNVNATDALGNTPLHIVVSNSSIYDETILQVLCDASAHLDYVNALRETPMDVASHFNAKKLLITKMKISLKCLCAQLIQKNKIPFREMIYTSLVNFVERH